MSDAVFIDLETTGLDPVKEEIVEFAIAVVDTDTWQIDPNRCQDGFIISPTFAERLEANDFIDFIKNMHEKSGLFPLVRKKLETGQSTPKSYETVEENILKFISTWNIKTLPVWGSSVHFDRKFLEQKMPKLNDYFHYRIVDSSSDMMRLKATQPELWKLIDNDPTKYKSPADKKSHRALEDIKHSIDLERRLAKWVTGPAHACSDLPRVEG